MEFAGFSSSQQHLEVDVGGWAREVEREHMFDKVVTPSDVGKLNRLVIPKQHAERYFPLDDNKNKQVGLFLNFEDRQGKSWRFRYSYWNSSQSYVMTKGWSRFVKDKNLDAGDLVSFLRHTNSSSFFIDCRRRPHHHHHHTSFSAPWTPLLTHWNWITTTPQLFTNHGPRPQENNNNMELSLPVQSGKKLRLFGVNMEMEQSTSSSNHDKGKPQSSNFMSLDFHM